MIESQETAETKALKLLRESGFTAIQQLDMIGRNNVGQWVVFEIKDKSLFEPGINFPQWGAGLNKSQLWLRTRLLQELHLRTYLLIFAKGTDQTYGAYLDELEKSSHYDTPGRIRIYPLGSFTKLDAGHFIESPVVQKQGVNNGS